MRHYALIAVLMVFSFACGGESSGTTPTPTVDQSSVIGTEVARAIQATAEVESAIDAAVAATQTAEAERESPTATLPPSRPTETPRTITPPSAVPTVAAEAPQPVPHIDFDALQRLISAGYTIVEKPEVSLMINPRLSESDDPEEPNADYSRYEFTDYVADYLNMSITVFKFNSYGSAVSDAEIRGHLERSISGSEGITLHEVVASDATSIEGHAGRVTRFTFDSDGSPGFGVLMLISDDTWLYSFQIYGSDYEYSTIEEILKSVFDSASLHHVEGA